MAAQVGVQVWHVAAQVCAQVAAQVGAHVGRHEGPQVTAQVCRHVALHVGVQVRIQVWHVGEQVCSSVGHAAGAQVSAVQTARHDTPVGRCGAAWACSACGSGQCGWWQVKQVMCSVGWHAGIHVTWQVT